MQISRCPLQSVKYWTHPNRISPLGRSPQFRNTSSSILILEVGIGLRKIRRLRDKGWSHAAFFRVADLSKDRVDAVRIAGVQQQRAEHDAHQTLAAVGQSMTSRESILSRAENSYSS